MLKCSVCSTWVKKNYTTPFPGTMKRANSVETTTAISKNGYHRAPAIDGSSPKRLRSSLSGGHSSDISINVDLDELFSDNVVAKIWAVASRALSYVC